MAPPREAGRPERLRRRKTHRRPRVRFHHHGAGKGGGVAGAAPPSKKSKQDIRPPENYENLILYYLTKLKNLFSSGGDHQAPAKVAETRTRPPPASEASIKDNVYNVVSAALEYGLANNVLEKRGDFFALRTRGQRIAARAPTPGPRRAPSNGSRYFGRCSCSGCQHAAAATRPPSTAHGQMRRPTPPRPCPRCLGATHHHHHHHAPPPV